MVERSAHPIFGVLAEHAVDLLLASSMDSNDSLRALREAALHASEEGPAPAGR